MATLRTVTTRFKFDTDQQGLKNLREGISGAKNAILGIASALALGAVGGALVKAGNNLQRAAILAKQFTDDVIRLDSGAVKLTGELAAAWERVQAAIPGQEVMSDFLNAFVLFRQTFKDAPLEQFETLFEAAGLLARITGKPLAETFAALHAAVVSGDFDALVKFLPEFDQMDANMQNFVKNLIEVDPTRVQDVQQRLGFIIGLLEKANPLLFETAEAIVETTAEGQWDNLINNIRRVTEDLSGPFHNAMVKILEPVNDFFDAWIAGGTTIQSFSDSFKQTFGVELPGVMVRSLQGMRAFLRDPGSLLDDLALGFKSLLGLDTGQQIERPLGRGAGRFALPGGGFTAPGAGFDRPGLDFDTNLFSRSDIQQLGDIIKGVVREGVGFDPRTVQGLQFAPTVNVTGDGPDLTRKVLALLESLWDQAADQFANKEEP